MQQLMTISGDDPRPEWGLALGELCELDGDYAMALQCYLQAAAINSNCFTIRPSCLPTDTFGKELVRRLLAVTVKLNLLLPAAVLCQCLSPGPDYAVAYQIVQSQPPAKLDAAFLEFIWEVPLLELLTHLYATAKSSSKVAYLTQLMQRPNFSVHNPPLVRGAAVAALQQRFLQKLAAKFLPDA